MPRKTETIYSVLKQELQDGAYRPGSCFASEPSLMRRFGVSRITINKITELLVAEGFLVRGRKGEGTRVASSQPFPIGRLALIVPYQNPYYDFLAKEIQRAALEHGYCVILFYPYFGGESRCLDMILRGRFIGLISCGIGMLPADFPLPVVYLDQGTPNDGVPRCSVTSNDYQAAHNIVDAVCRRGHRDIAVHVGIDPMEYNRQRRRNGFWDALNKNGISAPHQRIFAEPVTTPAKARDFWPRLLQAFPNVTVLLTDSNMPALRLMITKKDFPQAANVVVTTFSNTPLIDMLYHLPSVEQHPEELANLAVAELLHNATHPDAPHLKETELPTSLVNLDHIPIIN